jgi:hypothetical protein
VTQRERVLYELREAGEKGVRSDYWYEIGLPRGAARIKDLRKEGHEITSKNEHPFVRYYLVEVGAANPEVGSPAGVSQIGASADLSKLDATHSDLPSQASKAGVEQVPSLLPEEPAPPAKSSMYDPYSEAA